MKLIISACLLGEPCRYDGGSKPMDGEIIAALKEKYQLVPVCPECLGGLSIPRVPSERAGDRVVAKDGGDVTEQFRRGAEKTLKIALEEGCTAALLKQRSPSCGSGEIYDGSFTGTLVAGDGVAAALLKEHGIAVYGESEVEQLA
jgi:uncharacterized protein YbbK (DUF523 family)